MEVFIVRSPFAIKKISFRPQGLLNSPENSGVLRSVHFWTGKSCSMVKVNKSKIGLIESWVVVKVDADKLAILNYLLHPSSRMSCMTFS